MKGSSAAVLSARFYVASSSSSNTNRAEEEMFRTYPKVIKYLLKMYVTDDFISENNATLTRYAQPPAMLQTKYAEGLVTRSLGWREFCDEDVLKGIFIEEFHGSVRHSMRQL